MNGITGVTQILSQIESDDPSVAEQLLPLVYDELRQLAARNCVFLCPHRCPVRIPT